MNHAGSNGREGVVVAKFNLGYGEGVVLVDDRDDTEIKQLIEGILGVQISRSLS